MTTDDGGKSDSKESARKRVAKFRTNRRRFDYVPSEKALTMLEKLAELNPSFSWSAIMDALVLKVVTGNGNRWGKHEC